MISCKSLRNFPEVSFRIILEFSTSFINSSHLVRIDLVLEIAGVRQVVQQYRARIRAIICPRCVPIAGSQETWLRKWVGKKVNLNI